MSADLIDAMLPLAGWFTFVSAGMFIISLAIIPWYLRRLPEDFFLQLHNTQPRQKKSPGRFLVLIILNFLGCLLILSGIVMLFVPGQGLLTILVGLLLMSFPGKKQLITRLVSLKKFQDIINWSRNKLSCPPFIWK